MLNVYAAIHTKNQLRYSQLMLMAGSQIAWTAKWPHQPEPICCSFTIVAVQPSIDYVIFLLFFCKQSKLNAPHLFGILAYHLV